MTHIIEAIFDEIKHNYNIIQIIDKFTIKNLKQPSMPIILTLPKLHPYTFIEISTHIGFDFLDSFEHWLCPVSVNNCDKLFEIIFSVLDNDNSNKNGTGTKKIFLSKIVQLNFISK